MIFQASPRIVGAALRVRYGMEQKRALRPWRRRMAAEAVLASVLTAGVAVLPLWLAWAVFCRIRGAGGWWYMPAAWALLAALLYGIRYRPTPRRWPPA